LARVSLLAVLRFLLLLNQVAKSAAAGSGDIGDAGTLEVVLAADICTLHGFWDPVKTKAHGGKEEKARGVDWLITLHVAILAGTVMGLAESDAWNAVSDQASVNRREAGEKAVAPVLGVLWALGVDGLASVAQDMVEAFLPVVDIVVTDRTSIGGLGWTWLNWSLIDWSRHFKI